MERSEPWLVESAIKILYGYLEYGDKLVFEFGAGASTKWLNGFLDVTTFSVEHDKEWYEKVKSIQPCDVILAERPYDKEIDRFAGESFDVIIVDGRDRVKCIQSSIPKLKSRGALILDNSEREYYQKGIELMKDWNRIDCKQVQPDKYGFTYPNWTTSFFIKP